VGGLPRRRRGRRGIGLALPLTSVSASAEDPLARLSVSPLPIRLSDLTVDRLPIWEVVEIDRLPI
jgi:hypothetical protein